jgi:hypothetical protein
LTGTIGGAAGTKDEDERRRHQEKFDYGEKPGREVAICALESDREAG